MNASVILFEVDKQDLADLTIAFAAKGFTVLMCSSLSELESCCGQNDQCVAVLDLDNAVITNRMLRDLKQKLPFLQIIGISSRPFHPELKESMTSYLCACVSRPVDLEELIYLTRSFIHDLRPP